MAIGTPINRGTNGGGSTSATVASFTPNAGELLVAVVGTRRSTGVSATPTVSDSLGLTWTEIILQTYDTGSNPRLVMRALWAVATGAAMTVSAACADSTNIGLSVVGVTGAGTVFTNAGGNNNAAGDPSVVLAAPAATSAILGWAVFVGGNAVSPPSGYTELVEFNVASGSGPMEVCYDTTSPSATVSWVTSNISSVGIAMEVQEASAGVMLSPGLLTDGDTIFSATVGATYGLGATVVGSGGAVYAGAVAASYGIVGALVAGGGTIYAPSIASLMGLGAPLLAGVSAVHPATVISAYAVSAPTLPAVTAVFIPTIGGTGALSPSLLSNQSQFYGVVASGGVSVPATDKRATTTIMESRIVTSPALARAVNSGYSTRIVAGQPRRRLI